MANTTGIRPAERKDVPLILEFIHALGRFEKLEHEVVATPELLEHWIFDEHKAEVLFALTPDGTEAAFALYFYNFSTFVGSAGIHLEDLFVLPEYRHQGYAKRLISEITRIAYERGMGRVEWNCLDWNTNARNFYASLGAVSMDGWITYRLTRTAMAKLLEKEHGQIGAV